MGFFPEAKCGRRSHAARMSEFEVERVRGVSRAYATFREAVLDLSEGPTKANIARYLNASRGLDGQPALDPPAERPSRNRRRPSK